MKKDELQCFLTVTETMQKLMQHHTGGCNCRRIRSVLLLIGGDGTLIQAARAVVNRADLPLLGINMGTLGYLC